MQTETTITSDDVIGSADLASELLRLLVSESVPPGRAASALAIALGKTCAHFGVSVPHVCAIVSEMRYVEREHLDG